MSVLQGHQKCLGPCVFTLHFNRHSWIQTLRLASELYSFCFLHKCIYGESKSCRARDLAGILSLVGQAQNLLISTLPHKTIAHHTEPVPSHINARRHEGTPAHVYTSTPLPTQSWLHMLSYKTLSGSWLIELFIVHQATGN